MFLVEYKKHIIERNSIEIFIKKRKGEHNEKYVA